MTNQKPKGLDEHVSKLEAQQWEFIYNYKPHSDIYILRYGWIILGGLAGITGTYINTYYRKKLKMRHYGSLSTYLPLTVVPAITASVYHHMFITSDIVFEKKVCSVCSELKSHAMQLGLGIVYPLLMGPICCYMVANKYYTARIPSIVNNLPEFWAYHKTISKKLYRFSWYFAGIHLISSSLILHFESSNYLRLKTNLEKIEKIMMAKQSGLSENLSN